MRENHYNEDLWIPDSPVDVFKLYKSLESWVCTALWYHLKRVISARYGGFKNLRIIEIGAGYGKISIMMNLLGADTTLVDKSEKVLGQTEQAHEKFGCRSKYILADALDLPKELENKFDISMSFGTAEHFLAGERQRIFNAHFRMLKDKGLSAIQVPNAWGIFYRIVRGASSLTGRWPKDFLEIPYAHSELRRLGEKSGYINMEIVPCASLGFDFRHFISGNIISFLRKRTDRHKVSDVRNWNSVPEEKQNNLRNLVESNNHVPGIFSERFASSIMFLAERP